MTETVITNDRSKLAVTLIVIATATGLLFIGRLDGAQWVSTTTWTVAVYMLGQVGAVLATGYTVSAVAKAKADSK